MMIDIEFDVPPKPYERIRSNGLIGEMMACGMIEKWFKDCGKDGVAWIKINGFRWGHANNYKEFCELLALAALQIAGDTDVEEMAYLRGVSQSL